MLPIWEGYDEPYHFSFIQYWAANHKLPRSTTPVSREVESSLHLLPLSWEQRLQTITSPIFTEDSYWLLPETERDRLQKETRSIPPEWGAQKGSGPAMYEAQQAPLFYWLMWVPIEWAKHSELASRVMLIRLLSVLTASLLVPIAYRTANLFLRSREQAIALTAVIVCMPELMTDISRVGNESLAIVAFSGLTMLLLLAVRARNERWFVAAGIVLGLGLLTKAYFLTAIPAYIAIAAHSVWGKPKPRKASFSVALGLCAALIVSFPWYWRAHSLTNSWSGEENDAAAAQQGIAHVIHSISHVNWIGGVTSVLVSHVWFGGWSFLKLPKGIYLLFALAMVVSAVGLIKLAFTNRLRSSHLLVLLTLYGFFWVGLLYDILVVYIGTGVSASDGWYMYAVVLPEMLLVTVSLYAVLPQHWRWAVLPLLALAFAGIDLYGVHALLMPYYTGLIRHAPGSDAVSPVTLHGLLGSPQLMFGRLAANRPLWLGHTVIETLTMLYWVATLMVVGIAFKTMYRTEATPSAVDLGPYW
jgi:hypothetical protein